MSKANRAQPTQDSLSYQPPVPIQAMLHAIHQNQTPYFAWLATGLSDQHLGILGPVIEAQGSDGHLQNLDLSNNPDITDASVPRIIGLIQNSAIEWLDLSDTSITTAGIERIAEAVYQGNREISIVFSADLTITARQSRRIRP